MGYQIIREPDGKYAVFSSIVDAFVLLHATREEIIEDWLRDKRERLTEDVNKVCDKLDAGIPAYYQFTKSWEDALATHWETVRVREAMKNPEE